jgi:membrane protein
MLRRPWLLDGPPTMPLATLRDLARAFVRKWGDDQVATHGAALAYYTLFSIAPLLVVTIAVAGLVLGERMATSEVVARLEATIGPTAARSLRGMIGQVSSPRSGIVATILGFATMLAGATGLLVRLQSTLQRLWGTTRRGGWRGTLRQRAVGLAVILGLGLLVFASMLVSTTLGVLQERVAAEFPVASVAAGPINFVVALALDALAFALLFRVLPGAPTPWRDLWAGGLFTALLFAGGTQAIGWWLGRASTSVYGAASSLVVLLLWIYYSAQILLAGAVFTVIWSHRRREALQDAAPSG